VSTPAELLAAMKDLVAGVAEASLDPFDRVRVLTALVGAPMPPDGSAALASFGRRAALAALARAASECQPRSYDEAVDLRDSVCGLIETEETLAADAGEDGAVAALRTLRGAVDRDLTSRGASLSPLRDLEMKASLPALVLAQRFYGTAAREDEVVQMAGDPPNPLFMPERFRGLAR
jgi:prophage DNA circulation protein